MHLRTNLKMGTQKRILLTGASGTVGFEVLKQLYNSKNKYDITIFDIKTAKNIKKFSPYKGAVTIIYGDITKENEVLKACDNQDVVIHLAAIIPPVADDKPALSHQVNTVGTQILIRLLESHSPKAFFVYSSSISVYGDRLNSPMITVTDPLNSSEGDEYAKTKILAEETVRNCNLDWSIFRLTAIMGGHKISKLMFHQPLKTSLEIATPRDTARAFVKAIDHQAQLSKKIFNLGGGENCRIQYDDFLSKSFEIFGLGKLNFLPKSFADKNFHCGYYADGDLLNDILDFRKDTLNDYFENQQIKVSVFMKALISFFKVPIKKYLQKQSEPLAAYLHNDLKMIDHYFITNNLK